MTVAITLVGSEPRVTREWEDDRINMESPNGIWVLEEGWMDRGVFYPMHRIYEVKVTGDDD
jgi:hypothetical protein